MLGETIKGFKVTRPLGKGGMGEVWVAEQQIVKTQVAIKFLLAQLSRDEPLVQRFFNEAIAVSRIKHAGIVRIHDAGYHNGSAYLIMEMLEGETLATRLGREASLPLGQVGDIGQQVASILKATHAARITHRDLKPENIFLVEDAELISGERVKILDFGIAKIGTAIGVTGAGSAMGTPGYMAPEQWDNAATVDGRADIYALGCIAFKMCCGRLPFEAASIPEAYVKHVHDVPPRARHLAPGVPPELDELIAAALAKQPSDRPALREVYRVFATIAEAHAREPRSRSAPVHALPPGADAVATLGAAPATLVGHGLGRRTSRDVASGARYAAGTQDGVAIAMLSDAEVASCARSSDAGIGMLDTPVGRLPLVAMQIDARVAGIVAAIEVAQTFVNATSAALEATYIFPLPDRAAVHKIEIQVGGRTIDGVIDDRGAAGAWYEQAIAAGHRAAITLEERPGVFTLAIGNLAPGDVATVRLSLVGPLAIDDGEVTFRFPLVVAPRYVPGQPLSGGPGGVGRAADTDAVPDASRISPPVQLPGQADPVRLALRVAFVDGVVRDVASSLHGIAAARPDMQVIELAPGERLDRDLILRWRLDAGELRSQLVCAGDPDAGGGTFALTIAPPNAAVAGAAPRDVVFAISRSGSMAGWKLAAARRAVARMIDTLTARDRFCAIAFDDAAELMPVVGLVAATDRHRFRALEALARLGARGPSELARPLRLALGMLGAAADREQLIVLVTDGQVGNEDQVLRELARLSHVRLLVLGIDQAVNAALLQRLAAASGGLCELVESEDRLDEVAAKLHRRIARPIASELTLSSTGLEIDRASIAPARLPDVYAGAPIVIFGRYRGALGAGAAIEIAAAGGSPLCMTVAASGASRASGGPWLAALWARAHIRDLEDAYAIRPRDDLEQQIAWVSKQFGVLSRFTALVAVDRSGRIDARAVLYRVVQPVDPPAGWVDQRRAERPAAAGADHEPAAPEPDFDLEVTNRSLRERRARRLRGSATGLASAAALDAELIGESLDALDELAKHLAARAADRDGDAIAALQPLLLQWVDQARPVDGLEALVLAVEQAVHRLTDGGGAGGWIATAAAVAGELAALVASKRRRSRLALT